MVNDDIGKFVTADSPLRYAVNAHVINNVSVGWRNRIIFIAASSKGDSSVGKYLASCYGTGGDRGNIDGWRFAAQVADLVIRIGDLLAVFQSDLRQAIQVVVFIDD